MAIGKQTARLGSTGTEKTSRPIVALLTDFGSRDHYAGTLKGVVLEICREAVLVDITHNIPPHDVLAGALELGAACRHFPPGTVFLAVVDPGVGSARRPIAAEAGGHLFVAPDNGLLTIVFKETPPTRLVELTNPRFALPIVSRTFEGRDRFAPAAAWLAAGVDLAALGDPLEEWHRLRVAEPHGSDGRIEGEVLRVDHFGNLITNIDRRLFDRITGGTSVAMTVGVHPVPTLVGTYAEAAQGSVCALFGSTGHLEIAISGGNAAKALALGRGDKVTVVLGFRA